jgi:hypothetical protein
LKKATNAYVPPNYKSYGFVGHDLKKTNNTVSFIDKKDKGEVIYMIDNLCLEVLGKW